jgi:hypothetical protein
MYFQEMQASAGPEGMYYCVLQGSLGQGSLGPRITGPENHWARAYRAGGTPAIAAKSRVKWA